MATVDATELSVHCRKIAELAHDASGQLATLDPAQKNAWLLKSANGLIASTAEILAANARDISAAAALGLTEARIDRLVLDEVRIAGIARGMREIAGQPDPCGELIEGQTRPGGLRIQKIRVPLGVAFIIYESRPNVTADAAAICIKSGNAVILRGGKEAAHSSKAIVDVLRRSGEHLGLPAQAIQLVDTPDRDAVGYFLKMDDLIDVTIPRGGESLIRRVADEATMPVIKHFDGNCHVYVDVAAELEMAVRIVENAKCQRMGVCNACESLLIHSDIAEKFLPMVADVLSRRGVEMRGDQRARAIVNMPEASEADLAAEFLGPIISVAIVDGVEQAAQHVNRYGSHHTDAIVTSDLRASQCFTAMVDSAAVMVNASTRFNDGSQFGLGAEIGISTDKFHARGPCGLRELTTYKYIVHGDGHIRT